MRSMTKSAATKLLLVDCDGVLTPKKSFYSHHGRMMKVFDSDDSYALKEFKKDGFEIIILTADEFGFPITRARAKDWGIRAVLSSDKLITTKRLTEDKDYNKVYFVGNGPKDAALIGQVDHFFAPQDCRPEIKKHANKPEVTVLPLDGGEGVLWKTYQQLTDHDQK